jgi:hypothetical protein
MFPAIFPDFYFYLFPVSNPGNEAAEVSAEPPIFLCARIRHFRILRNPDFRIRSRIQTASTGRKTKTDFWQLLRVILEIFELFKILINFCKMNNF